MKIYVRSDGADYISCMATMPGNIKPTFVIGAYESGAYQGEPYLKIYDAQSVSKADHVTRLSLWDGHRIRHRNDDGKQEWEDINNSILRGLNRYLDKPSSMFDGYSNWQTLIYLWNSEVGFFTGVPPKKYRTFINAFFNGYYDTDENLRNSNYMPSTSERPDFRKQ